MFENIWGPKCQRCGVKNDKQADFCEKCGISLAFNRPAILNDNRWEAASDELAVFFMSRDLKGLFSKPLRVPVGMRAWILQDNKAEDLLEGEYAVESLFDRLNTFFVGKHAEIIITRKSALPVQFVFDDILSADLLPVTVETTLSVLVGDTAAFRNHFMLSPGAVSTAQLQELLKDSVRQIIVESLGTKRLEEMAGVGSLRQELDRKLLSGLQHRFKGVGLAFDQADTLSVRHDRFDEKRRLKGSYWLEYDETRMQVEHLIAMNELYSQDELAKIKAEEEEMRWRYRNAELKQNEADLAHVIRLRELDLYEKIVEAETRGKAIDLNAREQVEFLEQQYNDRRRNREKNLLKDAWREDDSRGEWLHTQEIAKIRHQAELRVAEVEKNEIESLARQRIENILEKLRIEGRIEQAKLIEDETARNQRLAIEAELLFKNRLREHAVLDARNKVAIDEITLSGEIFQLTEARVQAWEDKLLEEKIAEVDRRIGGAETAQRHDGMKCLIQLKEEYELSRLRIKLEELKVTLHEDRERQSIMDAAADKALEREREKQKEERLARQEERSHEIQYWQMFGTLSPEAMIALANKPMLYGKPVTLWDSQASVETKTLKEAVGDLDERLWKLACLENTVEAYKAHLHDDRFHCAHVDTVLVRIVELTKKEKEQNEVKASVVHQGVSVSPHRPSPGDIYTDPFIGMEFVYVQGGSFQMGDMFGDGDDEFSHEQPVHEVCVDDFWMGKYEVTQGEWVKVMGNNPSEFKKGPRYPVEMVSWDDAQDFIAKLNNRSGRGYRLPTEAEWEFAARERGRKVRFGTGKDSIGPVNANFNASNDFKEGYSLAGDYRQETTPVDMFAPNRLGLHDMSGNVWERCSDWYAEDYYSISPRDNPQGPASGSCRVIRGGSWLNYPRNLRAALRNYRDLGNREYHLGFRLVFPLG
ncbi:MAG: SUMF1/EgtB/PvdO family nonheme iron enzyme [Desulfobulbia bacterium]